MKTLSIAGLALPLSGLFLIYGCSDINADLETGSTGQFSAEDVGLVTLTPEDVDYIPLNPARGDAAPQAGVLWGDIRSDTASGTLLRFADGFSSPPHIHNITYRAVVIEGQMHNAAPGAPMNWMGPGSFWVQAAGEDHITAAKPGSPSLAFLEIETGPYLVEPSSEAFPPPDASVNLAADDIEWSSISNAQWVTSDGSGAFAEFADLWGDPVSGQPNARFLRLERGAPVQVRFDESDLRAVVIQGTVEHQVPAVSSPVVLGPGGFFRTNAAVANDLTCREDVCVVYLRTQ
ncbi:MAG: DUF4437 domain-containing protein [Pseudomonadota bacterium]